MSTRQNIAMVILLMCVAAKGEIRSAARSDSAGGTKKEVRIWTTANGEETIEGEYSSVSGDSVMIRLENNKNIKVPISLLSYDDQLYVEFKNPPKMKVEFRNSLDTETFGVDSWFDGSGNEQFSNDPILLTEAIFGAEVIQQGREPYNHDLFIEVFALTNQRYDPDKYHLIAHFKSPAFRLTEENDFRYKYISDDVNLIIEYDTRKDGSVPVPDLIRGEEYSDMLVLVRDEHGDVVGYNSTGNWLYKYLDRLEKLPVNAWLNNKCIRVHPSCMRPGE
ncbi:MAG: hypothetical protein JXR40_03175 [Pontiellaceae bacterium]|nr:hypothetical protein [Pontiellaceae bacterium]